ncbi:hypothetical protein DW079_14065, partial [Segatella copri]
AHLNMRRVVIFVLPRIPVMKGQSHEGSLSFSIPPKGPVIKVTVIKVIKDFGFSKIPQYPSIL